MFIRKTRKIDRKTKKSYFFFQLVESIRTEKGPRQRILLNLESELDLTPKELKELANRIEELAAGQTTCVLPEKKIESLAQKYASKLIKSLSQSTTETKKTAAIPDYSTIDLKTVSHQKARTVGGEDLLLRVAKELKLPEKLQELKFSKKQISTALGAIIARAIFPGSERATRSKLIHQSGLGELLDTDFESTSLNQFYAISDQLLKAKKELEKHIAKEQQKRHHYSDTIVLYDLTNTYMEGAAKFNSKAQFGMSKEKRKDCKLITLGLAINQDGFLLCSELLPGNVSEPKSLQKAIEAINQKESLFKPTIVMDAGIATEENLEWLKENNYDYIVSARKKAPEAPIKEELIKVNDSEKFQVKAAIFSENEEEKWLYCESEAKEAKAKEMKTFFQKRLEEELEKVATSLKKPKGMKKLGKVLERVGRIKEKHKRISSCYEIEVIPTEDGLKAKEIKWKRVPEKLEDKLTGCYYLRTTLLNLNVKELWNLYSSIKAVEEAFRFMKSSLGIRPVYHQKEKRVDGHLWITILAYTLIQEVLYRLRKKGIKYNWETIRTHLSNRIRVSTKAKTNQKKTLYLRTTTEEEPFHLEIYQALEFSSEILGIKKTLI